VTNGNEYVTRSLRLYEFTRHGLKTSGSRRNKNKHENNSDRSEIVSQRSIFQQFDLFLYKPDTTDALDLLQEKFI
jgi:hypothetical protein